MMSWIHLEGSTDGWNAWNTLPDRLVSPGMKPLLACSLALISSVPLHAASIVVQGGAVERSPAIVTFDAPADLREAWVSSGQGAPLPVQVDDKGKAVIVIPHLAANETLTLSPTTPPFAPEMPVSATKEGSVLRFTKGTEPMFAYQMEAGDVPPGVSEVFKHGAHLHPIYSPSGLLVTGNHPPDHRWHRGVWMAWTKTEFGSSHPDFWNQGKGEGKDKSSERIDAEVRFGSLVKSWSGPVQAGFVSKHRFIDHHEGDKDVLNETWEVTATRAKAGEKAINVIDLTSTQTCASSTALKLPQYHYGGLGVRGHALWDAVDAVTMLTSEGHDRIKGDSTPGKWVHIGGEVDGKATGMVILIHPSNFRFPQPLRLNPKNPQLCIAPSQGGPWSIEPGKPYVSRYRLVTVDGPADAALFEKLWNDYATPAKAVVK